MQLSDLCDYLDGFLDVENVPDYADALNGLQVDGTRPIRRVALAVDASQGTIEATLEREADLLIVHHGLFWDGNKPIVGRRYKRVRPLIESGTALYGAHLPLDVHPVVGNNAVLAAALGISIEGRFGSYKGLEMGVWGTLEIRREALAARLDEVLGGRVILVPGGPERLSRVGVITGGAGGETNTAIAAGLDGFITGEAAHHNYFDAREGGINLFLGGHYATEVWGVQALGRHLEEKFSLETTFIDQPTGL